MDKVPRILAFFCLLTAIMSFSSCNINKLQFPEELQGQWEYEEQWHFEWFIFYESELFYHRVQKPGSTEDKVTMRLTDLDEANRRFVTEDMYFLYKWEDGNLFLMFDEVDYPDPEGEWKDVHPY
jgi:hypothetical protein